MAKDINETLKTYEEKKYNSVGITNAKLAAVALYHLEENEIDKTFENVVIALQKLFPGKFSLITYPDIPDTIRVDNTLRLDAGKGHAEYLTGNRPKGYRLTTSGRLVAEETIQQLESSKVTKQRIANKDRNKYTKIISAIQTTEAYQKFISKQLSAINKLDSRRVLHCTLETPNEKALDNLNTLIKMALSLKPIKEYEELASNVLEFLKYLEDNWETLQNG